MYPGDIETEKRFMHFNSRSHLDEVTTIDHLAQKTVNVFHRYAADQQPEL